MTSPPPNHASSSRRDGFIGALSPAQRRVLETLQASRTRSVITGPPGSGKSTLCLALATILATRREHVLLLCADRPQAERLEDRLPALPEMARRRLTIETYPAYVFQSCIRAGCTELDAPSEAHTCHLLARSASSLEAVDALIVDDAQAFPLVVWEILATLVRGRGYEAFFYEVHGHDRVRVDLKSLASALASPFPNGGLPRSLSLPEHAKP